MRVSAWFGVVSSRVLCVMVCLDVGRLMRVNENFEIEKVRTRLCISRSSTAAENAPAAWERMKIAVRLSFMVGKF